MSDKPRYWKAEMSRNPEKRGDLTEDLGTHICMSSEKPDWEPLHMIYRIKGWELNFGLTDDAVHVDRRILTPEKSIFAGEGIEIWRI